jgi:hypothetical protein
MTCGQEHGWRNSQRVLDIRGCYLDGCSIQVILRWAVESPDLSSQVWGHDGGNEAGLVKPARSRSSSGLFWPCRAWAVPPSNVQQPRRQTRLRLSTRLTLSSPAARTRFLPTSSPDPSKPLVYGESLCVACEVFGPSNTVGMVPGVYAGSVAVGDGSVFTLAGNGVTRYDATTNDGWFYSKVESGSHQFAGIAVYNHLVWVGVRDRSVVDAFADWLAPGDQADPARQYSVPKNIEINGTNVGEGVLSNLKISGLDVAWHEIWISMDGDDGRRAIVVLDTTTGATKAVLLTLPEFHCAPSDPIALVDGIAGNGCTDSDHLDTNNITVACSAPGGKIVSTAPLGFDANECKAAVLRSCDAPGGQILSSTPYGFDGGRCEGDIVSETASTLRALDGPDIATVPEADSVVTACRLIKRNDLIAAAPSDLNPTGIINTDPTCGHESHNGLDAVWGMNWIMEVSYGDQVNEFPVVQSDNGPAVGPYVRREWMHEDPYWGQAADIAYNPRDTRLNWWGDLTGTDWERGTRCLRYVVSDADVFYTGVKLEHWYEQSKYLQRLDVRIDGSTVATLTNPSSTWCLDTTTLPSGVHTIELDAWINAGTREITLNNDSLHVDNDPPTPSVDPLPRFVRDDVTLTGTLVDAHSGPRDRQLQRASAAGTDWTPLCGTQTPADGGPAYSCVWHTNDVPDGLYRFHAHGRDLVSDELGGPERDRQPGSLNDGRQHAARHLAERSPRRPRG